MAAKTAIDLVDKQLLNLIQTSFPLAEEPYKAIAAELALTEEDVLSRLKQLKRRNIVRQISAIFDTRRLGYKTTLVAFRYPPHLLDKGAQKLNEHPGVSHNYARNGNYNLWFTLAVPPYEDLNTTVERMAAETSAEAFRVMPTVRFFKIGVNFDMVKNQGAAYNYFSPDGYTAEGEKSGLSPDWNKAAEITLSDIEAVRVLQEDLPLESRPFDGMARQLGVTTTALFALTAQLQERGIMRRFSAVLYHRKAGFSANAMAVWRVPEERAVEVGLLMAENPWVTHCYQRPTFPDWQYTHFTMIHAQTQKECEQLTEELSQKTGITEYQLLYSTREYKKTRVRYFVEEGVTV